MRAQLLETKSASRNTILKTNEKICKNCKHFLRYEGIDNSYGECSNLKKPIHSFCIRNTHSCEMFEIKIKLRRK